MSNTTNLRSQLAYQVIQEVQKAVIGKEDRVRKVMMAILSGGHVLLEDIPGVGKTTMALAFSKALSLKEKRLTFTPDVLPADLTGFTMYRKETGEFYFHPGALMCNLFLGDEINRTSPKTQSALLEVMEEGQRGRQYLSRAKAFYRHCYPESLRLCWHPASAGVPAGPFLYLS